MRIIILHQVQIPRVLLQEISDKYSILESKEYSLKALEIQLSKNLSLQDKEHFRNHVALHACDVIFPKPHFDFQQVKMIAFDMDSTLINIECIDEIARAIGKMDQVSAITEAAMRGEIKEFSKSLIDRVALLAGTPESVLEDVYQNRLRLNPGASELLASVKKLGWHTVLVSGGFTYFANRLKNHLNMDFAQSNTLEIEMGYLTGKVIGHIVDGQAKAQIVSNQALEHGIRPDQVIVMGDGSNDLPMMAYAGLSIGYKAKPIVKEKADGAFDHVGLDAILDLLN
jgi:phosphoserine phosphatase